jgi:putative component of toxin-antitoxin plasmid stabilization module
MPFGLGVDCRDLCANYFDRLEQTKTKSRLVRRLQELELGLCR